MPNVLVVRSGGGLSGLDIHAGMWKALAKSGIEASVCSGTSAGAIVSGYDACGKDAAMFEALIRSLNTSDVKKPLTWWKLRAFFLNYWLDPAPILKIMSWTAPERFSELVKPLYVWATDCGTGLAKCFGPDTTASVSRCVLASMSISGVFPWVAIQGHDYCDGGTSNYVPVLSNWREFDEVYLLLARPPVDYAKMHDNIIGRLLANIDWLLDDQLNDKIAALSCNLKVCVIRPEVSLRKGSLEFDHRLIDESYEQAMATIRKFKERR